MESVCRENLLRLHVKSAASQHESETSEWLGQGQEACSEDEAVWVVDHKGGDHELDFGWQFEETEELAI